MDSKAQFREAMRSITGPEACKLFPDYHPGSIDRWRTKGPWPKAHRAMTKKIEEYKESKK